MVITGGDYTMSTASIYSIDGWVEDLPNLLTGRSGHGCGHYINNDNKMVSIFLKRVRVTLKSSSELRSLERSSPLLDIGHRT